MMRWAADSCLTTRPGCAITARLALTRREPFLFLESLTQRLLDAQALFSWWRTSRGNFANQDGRGRHGVPQALKGRQAMGRSVGTVTGGRIKPHSHTVSLGGGLRGGTSPTRTAGAVTGHRRRLKAGQLWAEATDFVLGDRLTPYTSA